MGGGASETGDGMWGMGDGGWGFDGVRGMGYGVWITGGGACSLVMSNTTHSAFWLHYISFFLAMVSFVTKFTISSAHPLHSARKSR